MYWSFRSRPPKLEFKEFGKERLHISYVDSPYLESRLPELADRVLRNLAEAEKLTGASLDTLNLRLYNNYEEKGADVEDIYAAHADPASGTLYCIVNGEMDGTRERLEYELLLHKCCGKPFTSERGRIAAASLAGIWNQKTLDEWKTFLQQRRLQPAPESAPEMSPYIRIPWNAIFMRILYRKYGWQSLADYYKNDTKPPGFDQLCLREAIQTQPAEAAARDFHPEFQKGVSYAYENSYSAGYATRSSQLSLDMLQKDGVRWIASIPYGFQRSPDSTTIGHPGHSIFSESDESLFALATFARARGMKVMLKPQLWVSHNSWTGMIDFKDEASWSLWFQNYENWIVHYAIVAELSGADLFCIGTELVITTLKHPERWRKIITRVREVYHGPLVYAANYGQEFEKIQFWNALDYIGLDNYYAVRSSTAGGEKEMRAAFLDQKERIAKIEEQWNRPLIFTEIGYHANTAAGMGSQEEQIDDYDETMQSLCYRLAFETYWNEPWFYGMYWWKWFSNPEDRGKDADPHSPHGRLAEKVMSEWYHRPVERPR